MLKDHDSSAIVAASDLDRARAFYGDTLGRELDEEGTEEGVRVYRTGATTLVRLKTPGGSIFTSTTFSGIDTDQVAAAALVVRLGHRRSPCCEHVGE